MRQNAYSAPQLDLRGDGEEEMEMARHGKGKKGERRKMGERRGRGMEFGGQFSTLTLGG